jgi:hypothetical protein
MLGILCFLAGVIVGALCKAQPRVRIDLTG